MVFYGEGKFTRNLILQEIFLFPDRGKEPCALIGGMLFIVSSMVDGSKEEATENSLYLFLKISFDQGWGLGGGGS